MFGQNLQLIAKQCQLCKKWVAIRVDPEDVQRHMEGVFVQDAFPYLSPADRELGWLSGLCDCCWHLLCSENSLDYC
jgi:hypothetical protein